MQPKTRYTVLLSLLIFVPALWYAFTAVQHTHDQNFSYDSVQTLNKYVQITTGQSRIVPFAFTVDATVTEIILEVEDQELWEKGVVLKESIVSVINGQAASQALFVFPSQGEIKPGTYYLNILARDNVSGKIIHTGEIPFIVDMEEIVAGCSC